MRRPPLVRSPQDAEDAVQDAWLAFTRSAHTIENPKAVGGWLRVTTAHAALANRAASGTAGADGLRARLSLAVAEPDAAASAAARCRRCTTPWRASTDSRGSSSRCCSSRISPTWRSRHARSYRRLDRTDPAGRRDAEAPPGWLDPARGPAAGDVTRTGLRPGQRFSRSWSTVAAMRHARVSGRLASTIDMTCSRWCV